MSTGRSLPGAAALKGFNRVLAGSEFCQNRLPEAGVLEALRGRGVAVTLATSILTDAGLARTTELVRSAFKRGLIDEVVVNDWGILGPLKRLKGLRLSAGRLLCAELSAVDPSWAGRFLSNNRITSAESDDERTAGRLHALGLAVSWHEPYVFRAVTTFCPYEEHFRASCAFSCEGRSLVLRNRHLKEGLILESKAYFSRRVPSVVPRWAARLVDCHPI